MLRITKEITHGSKTRLQLEGRLIGEWVALLSRTSVAIEPSALVLDLSGVSYANPAGLRLLLEWQRGGAVLCDASFFLVEMLRQAQSFNSSPAAFASVEQNGAQKYERIVR